MPKGFQRRDVVFAVRQLFRDGVQLADHDHRVLPYRPGSVTLVFEADNKRVMRPVAHLYLRNQAYSTDLFPPLWSARIRALGERGMRLDGYERIADGYQLQAWHVVFG